MDVFFYLINLVNVKFTISDNQRFVFNEVQAKSANKFEVEQHQKC